MKKIKLTENEFNTFIRNNVLQVLNEYRYINSNKYFLTESQESTSQSKAVKYIMNNLGWEHDKAYNFVRNDLRSLITALRDKDIAKFTLGVTRMYFDNQLYDARTISNLNSTLKLLSAHLNEYDRNLNGLSAQELIDRFAQTRQDNLEQEKNEINSMQFGGQSRYQIVPINSFEEAKQYYQYTNPNSRWCLTHMEDMFDSYTSDGIDQIYFCLREGFQDVQCKVGEGCPLDEYGLSMLSIIVNENGELAYCTTRWNHENGGNDSAMTAKEISNVVGVNFYQVFKPNNKWNELLQDVMERIRNGEDPYDIFDYVEDFVEGFAQVDIKGRCNFLNEDGELINPNQWFDNSSNFHEGFAQVELNGKGWNFLNEDGELINPNQWFNSVNSFSEGFARVYLKGKGYNFINQNGEIVFPNQWFDDGYNFSEGFAQVKLNGNSYYINSKVELYDMDRKFIRNLRESISERKMNMIIESTLRKYLKK